MAQHDYVIANGTGAAVRSDLNNALAAIVSQNSGATAPATTYAFQFWADTTTGLLKLRNSANSAWVTLFQLDGEWSTLPVENGTAAAPSIYFKDSGTDTGFYSPGTDQIGISTAGTSRLTIDANGNLAVDTNTLYVDAPNNRVGIGTSSVSAGVKLQVADGTASKAQFNVTGYGGLVIGQNADLSSEIDQSSAGGKFYIKQGGTTAITIDTSQRVGIGITPSEKLHVDGGRGRFSSSSNNLDVYHNGSVAWLETTGGASTPLAFGNGGLERARIDTSGRLLVGTSSTSRACTQLLQGSSGGLAAAIQVLSSTASAPADGAALGQITFADSGHTNAVDITARRDGGTWSGASKPTRLEFSTTADSASSPSERFRIANNGAWGLAGANYGSSGQVLTSNGSGSAPTWSTIGGGAGTLQAFVNFNGTGTVAIRASGNVSSITDNGVGDYTLNFTTALVDGNYSPVFGGSGAFGVSANSNAWFIGMQTASAGGAPITKTTSACRIACANGGTGITDAPDINVAIFR